MRIEQLYYLVEVAKTNSITITAERNYVTQQNISDAISKLENELGVTLLFRSHKGSYLTDAGVEAVKKAKVILENVEDLKSTLKSFSDNHSDTVKGSLSVSTIPLIMRQKILPGVLNEFCSKHPAVILSTKENNNIDIIMDVASGKTDLGLIAMSDGILEANNISEDEFKKNIYFERLYYDEVFVCVGKNSPLAMKRSISIEELQNHPLSIAINSDFFIPFISKYAKKRFNPSVFLSSSSYDTQCEIIAKGMAIGFIMDSDLKHGHNLNHKDIVPIPFSENIRLPVGWIRAKNQPFSVAAKEFIICLKAKY
mgnify:CR=1 FL=1